MIELLRSIFRDVYAMIRENAMAFCLLLVSGMLAGAVWVIIILFGKLEKAKDDIIHFNYNLSRENQDIRADREMWRDSTIGVTTRYANHLEQDHLKSDTSKHTCAR